MIVERFPAQAANVRSRPLVGPKPGKPLERAPNLAIQAEGRRARGAGRIAKATSFKAFFRGFPGFGATSGWLSKRAASQLSTEQGTLLGKVPGRENHRSPWKILPYHTIPASIRYALERPLHNLPGFSS